MARIYNAVSGIFQLFSRRTNTEPGPISHMSNNEETFSVQVSTEPGIVHQLPQRAADAEKAEIDSLMKIIGYKYDTERSTVEFLFRAFKNENPFEKTRLLSRSLENSDDCEKEEKLQEVTGLEYLSFSAATRPFPTDTTYREILCSRKLPKTRLHRLCVLLGDAGDTFLVNRRLDYICRAIVEHALLFDEKIHRGHIQPTSVHIESEKRRLGANLRHLEKDRTQSHYVYATESESEEDEEEEEEQVKTDSFCGGNSQIKPPYIAIDASRWVIYTNINSEFYKYCRRMVQEDRYISVEKSGDFIDVTRVSFHLVLFFCGHDETFRKHNRLSGDDEGMVEALSTIPLDTEETIIDEPPIREARYAETNCWVTVPMWFLYLWSARTNNASFQF